MTKPRAAVPWRIVEDNTPLWHVPGFMPSALYVRNDELEALWRAGQAEPIGVPKKMPEIGRSPNGQIAFNRKGIQAYRYRDARTEGRGLRTEGQEPGVPRQMPIVSAGDVKHGGFPLRQGIQEHRYRESYKMTDRLKSPFPWPGGKSDQAGAIWVRLGDPPNYCEPFAGSAAVLLGRGHDLAGKTETLNDIDGHIINAFRAITFDPETTADWCDYPVSEADLTSRHLHLKAARAELTARLFADPFYFDPILAAFWLWGIASWIGDGWCVADGPWINVDGRLVDRRTEGRGLRTEGVTKQMPGGMAGDGDKRIGRGIQSYRTTPAPSVLSPEVLSPGSARAPGVPRQMPEVGTGPNSQIGGRAKGVQAARYEGPALLTYFARLSDRLRRVRFLCGDWRRAVKDSVTVNHGTTGVFLDPPYPQAEHDMAYHTDNGDLMLTGDVDEDNKRLAAAQEPWYQAAAWAVEHGDDPRLRICIAGYWSEATDALFPASWERVRWEARGGYANQKANGRGRANAKREILWFSPNCLDPNDEARHMMLGPILIRASDFTGTMFEEDDDG